MPNDFSGPAGSEPPRAGEICLTLKRGTGAYYAGTLEKVAQMLGESEPNTAETCADIAKFIRVALSSPSQTPTSGPEPIGFAVLREDEGDEPSSVWWAHEWMEAEREAREYATQQHLEVTPLYAHPPTASPTRGAPAMPLEEALKYVDLEELAQDLGAEPDPSARPSQGAASAPEELTAIRQARAWVRDFFGKAPPSLNASHTYEWLINERGCDSIVRAALATPPTPEGSNE